MFNVILHRRVLFIAYFSNIERLGKVVIIPA